MSTTKIHSTIANIGPGDAMILAHAANPGGSNFRKGQVTGTRNVGHAEKLAFVVTFSFHPTPSRDLRFLELGDGNYAGDRLLDHVDDHGFDFTAWRFRPLLFFSRGPLH